MHHFCRPIASTCANILHCPFTILLYNVSDAFTPINGFMLFRGTERNQRGIFRKMLKCGMIVSTTVIDLVADLWKARGGYSPLFPLANCSFHYMNMILKVSLLHYPTRDL